MIPRRATFRLWMRHPYEWMHYSSWMDEWFGWSQDVRQSVYEWDILTNVRIITIMVICEKLSSYEFLFMELWRFYVLSDYWTYFRVMTRRRRSFLFRVGWLGVGWVSPDANINTSWWILIIIYTRVILLKSPIFKLSLCCHSWSCDFPI